jgi:hypothetical protein
MAFEIVLLVQLTFFSSIVPLTLCSCLFTLFRNEGPSRKTEGFCEICVVKFATAADMGLHMEGQKHKKKVEAAEKLKYCPFR